MTLSPTFDKDVTEYSATTTSATNTVTATPSDEDATVVIAFGGDEYESGDSLTWETGENEVVITVTNGDEDKEYTVVVTKGE